MKITLIQMDIAWLNIEANILTAQTAIEQAPKSDLYVLPEMWSTGFVTEPKAHPEVFVSDNALQAMRQMAQKHDAAVAGSLAVRASDGTFRNRFFFVRPDGGTEFYDKRHLFTYGGEQHQYTRGESPLTVEWRGERIALFVCYDLRFPVFSRNNALSPYSIALYVASWPTSRISAWRTLLMARAIENQCYVCGVDRIGSDPACDYCGGTMAIDPKGCVIASASDHTAISITFETDAEALNQFRKKFPVLTDRDE